MDKVETAHDVGQSRSSAPTPSRAVLFLGEEDDADETGDPSVLGFAHDLTVEELFEFIQASLAEEPARAEITYDPELGLPTEAFFDFDTAVADEEHGFSAREFALSPN